MEPIGFIAITIDDLRGVVTDALAAELDRRHLTANPEPPLSPASGTDTMTRVDVLQTLHCDKSTLFRLEQRGELKPCRRVGRKPLWLRRDVERYLRGKKP